MTKILMLAEMEDDRCLYTVAEAAKVLGVTARTVRDWLRQGKIKGEKTVLVPFGNDLFRREWRIAEGDLGRPMRKPTEAGTLGAAVLAFVQLRKTKALEMAWRCKLTMKTVYRMRRGLMPRPTTLRKVYEAYPEQIESLMDTARTAQEALGAAKFAMTCEALLDYVRGTSPEFFAQEAQNAVD